MPEPFDLGDFIRNLLMNWGIERGAKGARGRGVPNEWGELPNPQYGPYSPLDTMSSFSPFMENYLSPFNKKNVMGGRETKKAEEKAAKVSSSPVNTPATTSPIAPPTIAPPINVPTVDEARTMNEVDNVWQRMNKISQGQPDDKYVVQPGDTLWDIANRVYGDPTRWQELFMQNMGTIGSNPDLIQPGQALQTGTVGGALETLPDNIVQALDILNQYFKRG